MAGKLPLPPLFGSATASNLNREPSPLIVYGLPWFSIMLGSLTPIIPLISSAPLIPPLGLLMLLAWRHIRPGVLPVWCGFPLGLFDDLFSGQPFGCAMLLWSIIMIAMELIEMRFPWRNFVLDWLGTTGVVALYLAVALLFANAGGGAAPLRILFPQIALSALLYPLVGRLVAMLDRARLTPVMEID